MMRKFLLPLAMLLAIGVALVPTHKQARADDFIDLDLTDVTPALRNVFRRAERFWESRINGYSNTLPFELRRQLTGRLSIDASVGFIDGPGNVLGQAGVVGSVRYSEPVRDPASGFFRQYEVATSGIMQFDLDDVDSSFELVVRHEMAHVLGIGSLWQTNGLNNGGSRLGLLQEKRGGEFHYIGKHGLQGFRRHSGHWRANYVPVENSFPQLPGTQLAHWDSDNFHFNHRNGNRTELMTGFITGRPTFISEATWGSLADMGWSVDGFNAGDGAFIGHPSSPFFPKTRNRGFTSFNLLEGGVTAVPEPSSLALVGLGLAGFLVRRKRG